MLLRYDFNTKFLLFDTFFFNEMSQKYPNLSL
nr:MAG TPA: hypothetical protein [Caudoviricetes sp.]